MSKFLGPVYTLQLASTGEVSLRFLTAGDTEDLFKIVAERDITDKEFVQAVLFHQLIAPKISKEAFNKIPDDDLKKLAIAFIENEEYTFKGYIDTDDIFADFRKPITRSVEEEERRFRETYGSAIKQAEKLVEGLKRSGALDMHLSLLNYLDLKAISGVNTQLSIALAGVGKLSAPALQGALRENVKAVASFTEYWNNYYALNARIINSVSTAFSAQILSQQKGLSQVIQEVSNLSIKNEQIFAQNLREINTYPREQKSVLYKEAGIRFFSINDFQAILQEIKKAVETNSQLMFWEARTRGILKNDPERIAQGLMMSLLYMSMPNRKVLAFQQPISGSGIVDILLTFSNKYGELKKIILELKVFGDGHPLDDGFEQTAQYMENEETEYGYRVIFDATKKELVPQARLARNGKKINDFIIKINLPNPSSLDKKNHSEDKTN